MIQKFMDSFITIYDNFHTNMTLKINVIFHHYQDYFEANGTNFKPTNGEHHESLNYSLKMFERKKGHQVCRKKIESFMHQQKYLVSILTFNVLWAGFIPQQEFRLRKRERTYSKSYFCSDPSLSPVKRSALKILV